MKYHLNVWSAANCLISIIYVVLVKRMIFGTVVVSINKCKALPIEETCFGG